MRHPVTHLCRIRTIVFLSLCNFPFKNKGEKKRIRMVDNRESRSTLWSSVLRNGGETVQRARAAIEKIPSLWVYPVKKGEVGLVSGLRAYCLVNRFADKGCIQLNPIPRLASEKGSTRRDNERAVSKYEGHKANLPNFCGAHSRDTPSWLGRSLARPVVSATSHCDRLFKTRPRGWWQPELRRRIKDPWLWFRRDSTAVQTARITWRMVN